MEKTGANVARLPKFAKVQSELEFFAALKERVYAEIGSDTIKGDAAALIKAVSFVTLYFTFLAIPLCLKLSKLEMQADALGLALASVCIGFCVMHDAIHGTLSENDAVNRWFGYTLDLMGCSSFFWEYKHNKIHHTWPNVYLYDDDIDIPIVRTHVEQPWKPTNRYQYKFWYWMSLYSLTYLAWVYKMDFTKLKDKKIGESPRKPIEPSAHELAVMMSGKAGHVLIALALPTFVQGWFWLVCYLEFALLTGFIISIVFQLAHLVKKVAFMTVPVAPAEFENANKVHQMLTTADVSVRNKLATFFLGGLNFQVEHHLFPEINSRHYPRIQKIVAEMSPRWGIPYHCFDSFVEGVRSHVELLKFLSKRP